MTVTVMIRVAVLVVLGVGVVGAYKDTRCFPPAHIVLDHTCVQDPTTTNQNYDCEGGHFVQSAGIQISCDHDGDCSSTNFPGDWCDAESKGYQIDARGCHCDRKIKGCTIQRFDKRTNEIQWSFCTPRERYGCNKEDYCSPPRA